VPLAALAAVAVFNVITLALPALALNNGVGLKPEMGFNTCKGVCFQDSM
jgi:hypothetical protein